MAMGRGAVAATTGVESGAGRVAAGAGVAAGATRLAGARCLFFRNGGQWQVPWCCPEALGKWGVQIQNPVTGKRQWLGRFDFAEKATRAYDAKALEYQGRRAHLNFTQDAWCASEIAPPNMRIVSKAKEQEHLKAEALIRARERQSIDPLVEQCLWEDMHLYDINEALLMTARNQKNVEDDPIDWDDLAKESDEDYIRS
nr:ethylene-responsive transcription factor 3-like [Aegilops tauschii subsp. strangulata]